MKNPDMRISRLIHDMQYHLSFLSLDLFNALCIFPIRTATGALAMAGSEL
jgi:hypothetical protein